MKLIKYIDQIFLMSLFLLLALVSCKDDMPAQEIEKWAIQWNVQSDVIMHSKALVDDFVLQTACTPRIDGYESIGLWGVYDIVKNGLTTTINEFVAEPLVYSSKGGGETNPYNDWNYSGEARYWEYGGNYIFRACFPQKLMTSLMTRMDATMFKGGPINTSVLQEDILVAATAVNTKTQNFLGPVILNMKHIFAAVMFKVKAVEGYTPFEDEYVTSCWLQNRNNETCLFSTSGIFEHLGNTSPEINWTPSISTAEPMYKWEHSGVAFNTENMLYIPNDGLEGGIYTKNDGWLLFIPQEVKEGTLKFCYTLSNGDGQVYSVNIPAITYECGKKYTYVLEIRGAKVDLTIAPWSQLESNHDITI